MHPASVTRFAAMSHLPLYIDSGLPEFLEAIYPHYDICFWCLLRQYEWMNEMLMVLFIRSQTSWRWLETKLVEMGIFDPDRNYKVCVTA
jgi:ubiquitin-like domain-containing CTD phosphatase 1